MYTSVTYMGLDDSTTQESISGSTTVDDIQERLSRVHLECRSIQRRIAKDQARLDELEQERRKLEEIELRNTLEVGDRVLILNPPTTRPGDSFAIIIRITPKRVCVSTDSGRIMYRCFMNIRKIAVSSIPQ